MKQNAQALSEWYAELAKNDNGFFYTGRGDISYPHSPNLNCNLDYWTVKPPKPIIKKIDLSVCIDSGIDMEFNTGRDHYWHVGKLKTLPANSDLMYYKADTFGYWTTCRVRQNHWHSWQGGKCPLPEGLVVNFLYRDTLLNKFNNVGTNYFISGVENWEHFGKNKDIVAFNVIGLADDWEY